MMDRKLWFGVLISIAFLYIAFRNVDLGLLFRSIRSTNPPFVILVLILTVLFYPVRALRWFYLLEPIKRTRLSSLFSSTIIGFAANFVLPARLGELIRANYIGRLESISTSSSLATIVVERLFDIFTILLIALIVFLFADFPSQWESIGKAIKTGGFFLLMIFMISILFVVGLKKRTKTFLAIAEKLVFFLPLKIRRKAVAMLEDFCSGLVFVKGASQLSAVVFYSLTLWSLAALQIYILCLSMGLSLPFLAPFFILTLICISVTLPSAPGYIGTFHLACQYGLMFYGFGREKALSMAIVLHAAEFIPTILLGAIILLLHHSALRRLTSG
jgi:uncharacterized protein (TIRG00374 family)